MRGEERWSCKSTFAKLEGDAKSMWGRSAAADQPVGLAREVDLFTSTYDSRLREISSLFTLHSPLSTTPSSPPGLSIKRKHTSRSKTTIRRASGRRPEPRTCLFSIERSSRAHSPSSTSCFSPRASAHEPSTPRPDLRVSTLRQSTIRRQPSKGFTPSLVSHGPTASPSSPSSCAAPSFSPSPSTSDART